jgi:hypothetical protein
MRKPAFSGFVAWTVCVLAAHAEGVTFTARPAVQKEGGKYTIAFAVSANTDVAVYVEDARGEVVRHLAAGVLGRNAPPPLAANSLAQQIGWDGANDDGRPAGPGPFRVRVGLGLTAVYAGEAFAAADQSGPNKVESVLGMAVGPDGRLYVLDACRGMVWSGAARVLVFRRDGSYERTIKPFPANLAVEKAQAVGAFTNAHGKFNPLIQRVQGLSFYTAEEIPHQPAVTPDGKLVLAVNDTRLALLDGDGGIPTSTYAGPALGRGLTFGKYPYLAAAADAATVYLSGLGPSGQPSHAIYAAALSDRGPAKPWFAEPGEPGADHRPLNDVRGLAVDGKGHLLASDYGNNRVLVLNEADRSVAGSLPVKSPNWVAVQPRTGAVYVQAANTVIKFSGWKQPAEVARVELTPAPGRNQTWRLALDATAEPAVLWSALGASLLRREDRGTAFSAPVPAGCYPAELYWRPAVDPARREVLCRKGGVPGYGAWIEILDEATGRIRTLGQRAVAGQEGRSHRLGPDGCIYFQDHGFQAGGVARLDRDGNPKPFPATLHDPHLRGRLPVGTTGTTMWERDFSVDRQGNVFVKARGPEYHGLMSVHVYDPQGNLRRIALEVVSDGMYGPRVDCQGNLYVMESVKAPGVPFPPEFNAVTTAFPAARDGIDWIYGSVVKFAPAGGAIWFSGQRASPLTYEGWGADTCISGLRTTGGCLIGSIVKPPATLHFPSLSVDAAAYKTITLRLKNQSEGQQAVFVYHRLKESYLEACGPGFSKTIDLRPGSDFAEYTFDLSGDKDWRETVHNMSLVPTTGTRGTFSLDWVRIGGPQSRLVWNFEAEDGPATRLPDTLQKEKVAAYGRPQGAELQGALWWKAGFSPLGDMSAAAPAGRCHCTGSDFDVDDFGRVFAPDTGRFRVGVLDTAGNDILSFGGYGNQDCCGPQSYVVDPQTGQLRPRRPGDPQNLPSPSATPEIGLAWIIGLAVTDRYAYVSDVINKRVLRVKLGYATEDTCEVK